MYVTDHSGTRLQALEREWQRSAQIPTMNLQIMLQAAKVVWTQPHSHSKLEKFLNTQLPSLMGPGNCWISRALISSLQNRSSKTMFSFYLNCRSGGHDAGWIVQRSLQLVLNQIDFFSGACDTQNGRAIANTPDVACLLKSSASWRNSHTKATFTFC